jgi:hypothetical protein
MATFASPPCLSWPKPSDSEPTSSPSYDPPGHSAQIPCTDTVVPIVGAAGCLVLAFSLPLASVLWGAAVIAIGAGAYGLHKAADRRGA